MAVRIFVTRLSAASNTTVILTKALVSLLQGPYMAFWWVKLTDVLRYTRNHSRWFRCNPSLCADSAAEIDGYSALSEVHKGYLDALFKVKVALALLYTVASCATFSCIYFTCCR